MTGERPDDALDPDGTSGPADGTDDREALRASAPDAPFRGLRSAADIFGAPRAADDWPSRRERREAERAARETGAPLPEPFEPEPFEPEPDGAVSGVTGAEGSGWPSSSAASSPVDPDDAGATQAIRMDDELREPSENPQAAVEHERETLGERIPPAAPVPPTSTVSHPSSISLPTAMSHREQRAAENRAVDDERRRLDPFGQGRSDVDWLGRATGTPAPEPTPTGPGAQPLGVGNVLPPTPAVPTNEPPSFTELLRLQGAEDATGTSATERPFDWAIRDDETGEVPTTLTTDRFDTTALGARSWSLADESDDDVVSGEVDTPAGGLPSGLLAAPAPVVVSGPAPEPAPIAAAPAPAAEPVAAAEHEAPTTALPAPVVPQEHEPDLQGHEPDPQTHEPDPQEHEPDPQDDRRPLDVGDSRAPERLPADAPDDLDQSEWDGRETSDTSVIKDLFGTAAVGQLGDTGYDPEDSGTRMMPAVDAARPPVDSGRPGTSGRAIAAGQPTAPGQPIASGRAVAASAPDRSVAVRSARGAGSDGVERDNFINEGFGRLAGEGKRGKQLLVIGAVVLIVVLLVAVFGLTRWILGGSISEESAPAPTATATAAASSATAAPAEPSTEAAAPSAPAQPLQFATTPAAPGEHAWTDLAGGECLSPFEDAWAQTFTVVDCATAHAAQLTARVQVEAGQWPGPDSLAAQAVQVCQSAQAIDTAAAASYGDVQVQGSYAPDQETWDRGNTFISCFATRSSGQPLTGSLAPTGA